MNGDFDSKNNKNPAERPNWSWLIIILVIALFVVPWFFSLLDTGTGSTMKISYSTFREQMDAGNIDSVTIQGEEIRGIFKNPGLVTTGQDQPTPSGFVTYIPQAANPELIDRLASKGIQVNTLPTQQGNWLTILLTFLPFIFIIWIGYVIYKNMQSQGRDIFSMGASQAKVHRGKRVGTTFNDVAGIDNAKKELKEVIDYLKKPQKYIRFGATIPKGVLLVGPPGSGKTLLARAVAGEAGVPFFNITGSDFMEMFVGVGAARVRNLFKQAKEAAPSIIFIDELDSIGRHRGAGIGGGHDEREQTLNQLLSEMDGFEPHESVIVMAATNRPDILDPALMRPGRFDRHVTIPLPTLSERIEILKIHARKKPIDENVDFKNIAKGTPGFSGADLENLLNEAALLAVEQNKNQVEQVDLDGARDKILMGLERRNMALTEEDKKILAYHEGGHAIVAAYLPGTDPIHKVTIIPRDHSMGVTQLLPDKDRYIYDKQFLLNQLAVMMGGRAAEKLKINNITSGAEDDLKHAQHMARKMVLDWGMSDVFENLALGTGRKEVFLGEELGQPREYSEETAHKVDLEVQRILNEAYMQAIHILKEQDDGLEQLALQLIEHEELVGSEVYKYIKSYQNT
jgi:cell division protease FtsH